ncbi:hypothetical protein D9M71_743360 [compost metagenome]
MGQRGLAQAGQILDQQMSPRQQCDKRQPHLQRLAQQQGIDLLLRLLQRLQRDIG